MILDYTARALFLALFSARAFAYLITPLDTFPASGVADGPDAGIFARAYDAQAIALPFHLPAPGRITQIDTGFQFLGGMCSWRFGVIPSEVLYGSTTQFGFPTAPWSAYVDLTGYRGASNCLWRPAGSFTKLSQLDWFLSAGDYFLVATPKTDMEEAHWFTNASLLSDDWAIQAIGYTPYSPVRYPCGGHDTEAPWQSLEDCGIGPKPTPVARIIFETNEPIPEPASLPLALSALLALGLAQLWPYRATRAGTVTPA